jgi:hypothetical protein
MILFLVLVGLVAGMNPIGLIGAASSMGSMVSDPNGMGEAGGAMTQLLMPAVADILSSQGATMGMYSRKTQPPMIWIKLRKAPPIIVDREFYNISTVLGMEAMNLTKAIEEPKLGVRNMTVPAMQTMMGASSLAQLKVDPQMIQNGLYLSQPLRQPAQESINIATTEDVRTIQGIADHFRKKREIKRLKKRFNDAIQNLITDT